MFLVLKGRLRIETEHASIDLREGEMFIVPTGMRHNPVADDECYILSFERKFTAHTGNVITGKTKSIEQQLGATPSTNVTSRRRRVSNDRQE